MAADASTAVAARSEVEMLVSAARAAVGGSLSLPPAHAPRAAALLARCALEAFLLDELDRLTQAEGLGRIDPLAPLRHKLICYRALADQDVAARAAWAWSALSSACHQHAYQLSPTHAEVQHLLEQVEQVTRL